MTQDDTVSVLFKLMYNSRECGANNLLSIIPWILINSLVFINTIINITMSNQEMNASNILETCEILQFKDIMNTVFIENVCDLKRQIRYSTACKYLWAISHNTFLLILVSCYLVLNVILNVRCEKYCSFLRYCRFSGLDQCKATFSSQLQMPHWHQEKHHLPAVLGAQQRLAFIRSAPLWNYTQTKTSWQWGGKIRK